MEEEGGGEEEEKQPLEAQTKGKGNNRINQK